MNESKEQTPLDGLIEALTIFKKYDEGEYPTNCSHDELTINIDPVNVSEEDIDRLDDLGFYADEDRFYSYRYGSC